MPAAAVIPAPRAYSKVAAIKTLVVGLQSIRDRPLAVVSRLDPGLFLEGSIRMCFIARSLHPSLSMRRNCSAQSKLLCNCSFSSFMTP